MKAATRSISADCSTDISRIYIQPFGDGENAFELLARLYADDALCILLIPIQGRAVGLLLVLLE